VLCSHSPAPAANGLIKIPTYRFVSRLGASLFLVHFERKFCGTEG
jgi:hypothetical protein